VSRLRNGAPQPRVRVSAGADWIRRVCCGTVDDDEVGADRDRPSGIIKRDRPRPAVVTIDVGHPVQVSVVIDDVAFLKVR
jgi:hypothetical protein